MPNKPAFMADPQSIAAMRSSRPPSRGSVRAYDWLDHHGGRYIHAKGPVGGHD